MLYQIVPLVLLAKYDISGLTFKWTIERENFVFFRMSGCPGLYLGFQKGMVPPFKKGHLLSKIGSISRPW
jgi:hypothetical protein